MPISVMQIQAARLDVETRGFTTAILKFLKDHQDLAYSTAELKQALLPANAPDADRDAFAEALLWLSDLGLVDERIVRGEDYFLFVADFTDLR